MTDADFDLWLLWCERLARADRLWDKFKDGPLRREVACARRMAERKCDKLELLLTE